MEYLDVMMRQDDGVAQFIANQLLGFVHLGLCDGKVGEFGLVELQFIFAYSLVATLTNVVQHGAHGLVQLRQVETWTRHNLAPQLAFRIFIYIHDNLSLNSQLSSLNSLL